MSFIWATATSVGLLRDHNEDAVSPEETGAETGTLVIGVADGMGGHVAGEIASRIAIEAATKTQGGPLERAQAANVAVVERSQEDPKLRGMGTTLTLAVLTGLSLEIAHIGDSRAYRRRRDELDQLTTDHSLMAEMIAAGELAPEEAAVHPYRSVITRAIGLDEKVRIDEITTDLEPGDRILLCTDGLTNMVDDPAIGALLDEHETAADAVGALIDAANKAGGVDNVTVAVVDVARDTEA
jgi:protein phosphatase